MFRSLVLRLVRSKRVGFALASNSMVSVASFLLSVSIARVSSIVVFSEFSLAMVSYLFITGLSKAAFTNTALSRPEDETSYKRSLKRSSLVSLIAGAGLLIWSAVSGNVFLLVLSLSLPGMVALDFIRTYNSAAQKPLLSLVLSTLWTIATAIACVVSVVSHSSPILIFSIWAIGGSICGFSGAIFSRVSLSPRWPKDRTESSAAVVFSADYLVGAGGAQLTTGLLGFIGDSRILGAIRGAGTLLGPINLISTTARSLLLPYLSRDHDHRSKQFQSAVAAAVVQISVFAPLLLLLQWIPEWLGTQLLGETWKIAAIAILPMSIDALFNAVMAPAIAGHRVAFAGSRSIIIRLLIGIPRPFVVLYCAYSWGVFGAAWAMAFIAIVSSIAWWVSYYDLCKKAELSHDS